MKLRPTIFLSGVSSEFRSFRDAAEIEVQKKGCFPINQPSFGVDYRTIEEILRRNIGEADAVIHIVGFRFGFEPRDRPADQPRRSYTQMEYDIAREFNKPVYVFLSADGTVRDANPSEQPEDAEAIQFQLEHRRTLEQLNYIRYSIRDKGELCRLVAAIPLLATADFRVDIGRIDRYAPAELIGREGELKLLDDAWLKVRLAEPKRPHILTFVALGGEGKTSLIAKWLAQLAYDNWPGCDSAFAWSFYSQGTREQHAASSDLFLKEALMFFGDSADREFAGSTAGAYEKGQRLARILGQRHALLILDGLEPLQYSPTASTPGELKDGGLTAILKGLAAHNDGLCIITTRYSIPNLKTYWQTTAREIPLTRLSLDAAVYLLRTLEVKGSAREFKKLVEDVNGHALTLNLLGTYLRDAHSGDIRRRDLVKLEEADPEVQGGHAFRVIEAYERSLEDEGEKGKRALAILRLLGLFDRPVSAELLVTLLQEPAIPRLTELLVGSNEGQLNLVLKRLDDAKVLIVNRETSGALVSLDAHPLLREYFARQLRMNQPETWRAAHQRLYEYLCTMTPHKQTPTLEDLQPLYQAILHGCQAGLEHLACVDVYIARITRRHQKYSAHKLGAFASDLGAIACFFSIPWTRALPAFKGMMEPWLLTEAAFCLRSLGRMTEAVEAMRIAVTLPFMGSTGPAVSYGNLSEMELILGRVPEAVRNAQQAVKYVDDKLATYADALHQAGNHDEAKRSFQEAEEMQAKYQPKFPMLYSLNGIKYCDLLLAVAERASWQKTLDRYSQAEQNTEHIESVRLVANRIAKILEWAEQFDGGSLLEVSLSNLILGRAAFYESVLLAAGRLPDNKRIPKIRPALEVAVSTLRRASRQDYLPRALVMRSWVRFTSGAHTGPESAQEDLDEAWEIAERGPMRLHMADIHLYRARLFFREKQYPWESQEADLAAARKLIEQCGYWRRKEELEDAERVILKRSV